MRRSRSQGGYIDPIMSVLPLAFLVIVFGVPALLGALAATPSDGSIAWLRVGLLGGVFVVLQGTAILLTLEEAHHDGFSGDARSGLARAPALRGLAAPWALALSYLIGIWPLRRVPHTATWPVPLYAGLAAALALGGLVARRRGRAKRSARRTARGPAA